MAPLVFLLLSIPLFAEQVEDLATLLEKVQRNYATAKAYYVEASVAQQFTAGPRGAGWDQSRIVIAGESPGKFRFEFKGNYEFTTVSDGLVTWAYAPRSREYTREAGGALEQEEGEQTGDSDDQSRWTATLIGSHASLLRGVSRAEELKQEEVRTIEGKVKCRVVQIHYVRSGVRQYWIDPERSLILKLTERGSTTSRGTRIQYEIKVDYRAMKLNADVPADAFVFSPPPNSKAVKFLDIPGATPANLLGKSAPEIELKTFEGEEISLRSLRGKLVLVDFWASWCRPCRDELPSIARLQEELRGKDVVILGVNAEGKSAGRLYLRQQNLPLATLDDAKRKVSSAYKVRAIPAVFIINRQGQVAKVYRGLQSREILLEGLKESGL